MLKKLALALAAAFATTSLAAPAPASPGEPRAAYVSQAAEMPVIAPGRFDGVRVGSTLQKAAESEYFDLNVKGPCGVRRIWATKPWRKSVDIYSGVGKNKNRVASIGIFGDGIATVEGIQRGSTLAELKAAYGDRLIGPVENEYRSWGYFIRDQKRWLGFGLDATGWDGPPTDEAVVAFMELSKGSRPGLMRDGC